VEKPIYDDAQVEQKRQSGSDSSSVQTVSLVGSSGALGGGNESEGSQRPGVTARFFRPELDVLRLFAFSLVFVCHVIPGDPLRWKIFSNIRDGAVFGVPVFFLLSAFLITELLIREKKSTGTVDIRSFYIRRVLRIWPLYFLSLFIAFVLPRLTHSQSQMTVPLLLAYLFLVGNWASGLLPYGFGVLWSISVEEQFYVVWPTLIRLAREGTVLLLCVAIWGTSQIVVVVLCHQQKPWSVIWASTFVQMQYFALGGILSIALRGKAPKLSFFLRSLMVAGGVAIFIAFPRRENAIEYVPYLAAGLGTVLIFFGFLGARIPRRLQFLQYLGKISYGLYVIHASVLAAANYLLPQILHRQHGIYVYKVIIGLPVTIVLAHFSYRYFEKPFLRLKERFEVVQSRAA
jgi:peptidoglycan/LPS O-acetylase OafA/YrhL